MGTTNLIHKVPQPASPWENFTFASFFACAGGADFGMKAAGANPVYVNEFRRSVAELHRLNHGFPVDTRSITETGVTDYGSPTIMLGGFPCQPFSKAGNQLGGQDARGQMGVVFAEKIMAAKPPAFICENVAPFLTKPEFADVYGAMLAVWGDAYVVTPTLLNACHYGVPQSRERAFIIGYRRDLGIRFRAGTITPSYHTATIRTAIADLVGLAIPMAGKSPLTGHEYAVSALAPYLRAFGRIRGWDQPSYTVVCGIGSLPLHPDPLPICMAGQPGVLLSNQTGTWHRRLTVRECARIQTFPDDFAFGNASLTLAHDVLGNAIPPDLMERIAVAVRSDLVRAGVVSQSAPAQLRLVA
ncbi:Modification methylase HaeIII [Magnetospirillum gryphiswaldense MSR-1]|uniref:DNA (cytosine-5-)-methyltransferase n=1 Tax=Magnetospirillum gryphiswaldense TaxID=55518 RepID=A4U323_9PROT|nr:Modification methylase HaeIII [Magnetospirillum gryphiswaldense MSR-1]AVM79703.1 Modification methylase HaeIII [Magnetospirillum gryphiswaldense]CAM77280.1 modification methylase MthTI [Magnetospirillum gryphiswaldense MSR-1]